MLAFCVILMMAASSEGLADEHNISKVDWYKPTPNNLDTRGWATIYNNLTIAVPERLHREASTLLGKSEVIELTREQAKHFGFSNEPDSILRTLIHQSSESLAGSKRTNNPYEKPTKDETQGYLDAKRSLVNQYGAEIKRYQAWMDRLRPYLIRSVTFQETHDFIKVHGGPEDFWGILGPKDLVLYFGSSGVTSRSRFRMIRMPVVVYLPYKPRHVYTDMTLMW